MGDGAYEHFGDLGCAGVRRSRVPTLWDNWTEGAAGGGGKVLPIMIDLTEYKNAAHSCWLLTQELAVPNDDRSRLSLALLQLAQEHHANIVLLLEHRQYGSAFALVRPLYEAFVRGVWAARIATDNDLVLYQDDQQFGLKQLAAKVAKQTQFEGTNFEQIVGRTLNAMHSYTHNGYLASVRRLSSDAIEPAYEMAEIREVLGFAQLFGVLATAEILEQAANVENIRINEMYALVDRITMKYPLDCYAVER